jgi:hypothetical protein
MPSLRSDFAGALLTFPKYPPAALGDVNDFVKRLNAFNADPSDRNEVGHHPCDISAGPLR